MPAEDELKLKRLWMDLRWLVVEGYVTEYSDGKLFAPPPMTENVALLRTLFTRPPPTTPARQ